MTSELSQETRPPTQLEKVEAFQEMDHRDENQILQEMRGEQLQEFVYSIPLNGRQVTNLSYAGVKEAIRRRGRVEILEVRTEQDEKEYRALVRVRDHENQVDVVGASTCEKTKPFSWTLAVNKAERNAWMKLIPAKWIATLINEWLTRNQSGGSRTIPRSEIPVPAPAEPAADITVSQDQKRESSGSWTIRRSATQGTTEEIKAGLRQFPLLRGLQSFGMINVQGDQVSIVPEKPIPAKTALIEGFLCHKILDAIKRKHGIEYELETTLGGDLVAILLRGEVSDVQIKELVNAARWAFEKSLTPQKAQPP